MEKSKPKRLEQMKKEKTSKPVNCMLAVVYVLCV
jgi:hypothetical protein